MPLNKQASVDLEALICLFRSFFVCFEATSMPELSLDKPFARMWSSTHTHTEFSTFSWGSSPFGDAKRASACVLREGYQQLQQQFVDEHDGQFTIWRCKTCTVTNHRIRQTTQNDNNSFKSCSFILIRKACTWISRCELRERCQTIAKDCWWALRQVQNLAKQYLSLS